MNGEGRDFYTTAGAFDPDFEPADSARLSWLELHLDTVLIDKAPNGAVSYGLMGPRVPWPQPRKLPDGPPYPYPTLRALADAGIRGTA